MILSALLAACSNTSEHTHHDAEEGSDAIASIACSTGEPPPALGLMTSLPLSWELGSEIADFAQGKTKRPWQAVALSSCFTIVPLDTLAPIDEPAPDQLQTDPLAGLSQIAIVQPRGLTPAGNAALDEWVRKGGKLLLVLDPLLTGHYDLPLGDPRRPMDTFLAAIPPVVTRWGLQVVFDEPHSIEEGTQIVDVDGIPVTVEVGSRWQVIDPNAAQCDLQASDYAARCKVGEGQVTLVGDAAIFEHRELAGDKLEAMTAIFGYAFD